MNAAELEHCRRDSALLCSIISQRVKLKRDGSRWKGLCPFHAEKTPSFTLFDDGGFKCFGCGASGTVFDYVMLRDGVAFPRAVEIVAAERGITVSGPKVKKANGPDRDAETWLPMVPPPAGAPKPVDRQLQCDMLHEYCGPDDGLLCYVRRHEAKNGKRKQFPGLTYGTLNGRTGWHDRGPNSPRPLYGLNRLSRMAGDAVVIMCEGEKSADAAQRLLPGYICMTWMGGAGAVNKANWAPLAGRRIVIWPDADREQPGGKARPCDLATTALMKLFPAAAVLDTAGLAEIKDGYDAADLEYVGCDDAEAWLRARLPEPSPQTDISGHRPNPDEILLSDLQTLEIEPLRWVVPGYLPEGLTVFAGRPKIGKSWFILNIALAIARGTEALCQFVEQGDVLYCGLEDGTRRMKSRVEKILGVTITRWPDNFIFRRRLAPLDQGGLETIEQWLIAHPKRRLVVIDVLGRVRGAKRRDEEAYQYDYRLLAALQELAITYRVAIVVVHHVRKADAEDVLDTISGTTGIAGACDLALVLGRTKHGVRLAGRGRDTEEIDKLVEFDHDNGLWSVTGEYDEATPDSETAATRRAIHDLLADSPVPLTPARIAERLKRQANVIRVMRGRMLKAVPAQVGKNPDGSYTLPARVRV